MEAGRWHPFPPECAEQKDAAGERMAAGGGKGSLVGNPLRQDPTLRALPGTREQRSSGCRAAESWPGILAPLLRSPASAGCRRRRFGPGVRASVPGSRRGLCAPLLRVKKELRPGSRTGNFPSWGRGRGSRDSGELTLLHRGETRVRGWGPSFPLPSQCPQRGGDTRRVRERCKRPACRRRAPFLGREPCTWQLALPGHLPGAASEGGEGRI